MTSYICNEHDLEIYINAIVEILIKSAKITLPHKEFKKNVNLFMATSEKGLDSKRKPRGIENETYRCKQYKYSNTNFQLGMEMHNNYF